jgi:thioredoxin reductase (NADPH)
MWRQHDTETLGMSLHKTKVLIIGAGPAGYTAAIYTARAALQPMLVAGLQPGGQLMITTEVENYPGFAEAIQGPWLMEQMQAQAAHVGTEIISDIITEVDFSGRPFRCVRCSSARAAVRAAAARAAAARAAAATASTTIAAARTAFAACSTCLHIQLHPADFLAWRRSCARTRRHIAAQLEFVLRRAARKYEHVWRQP